MSELDGHVEDAEQSEASFAPPAFASATRASAAPSTPAVPVPGRAGRPPPLTPPAALALQRSAGNRKVAAGVMAGRGSTARALVGRQAAPLPEDEEIAGGLRESVRRRHGDGPTLLREDAPEPAGGRQKANLDGLPPQVADRIREKEQEEADKGEGGSAEQATEPGEIDRSQLAAEKGPLESQQKAAAPKPEEKLGEMTAAANAAKEAADAPPAAPPGGAAAGPGAAPAAAGAAVAGAAGDPTAPHKAAAAAAMGAAQAVSPPDEPPPVATPEPVVPVDAAGVPLPGAPEAEATTAALVMKAQILREQGHALRAEAAGELAGAHALSAQIAESRGGVADADDAIAKSRQGVEYRRGAQDQAKQALKSSEEKQAMVAEKAPELSAKAAEQQADSKPMAGEASELADESKSGSAQADDEEAAGKANEQGGQLTEISGQVGQVDNTFGQSKQRADSLAQEAAQAKVSNDATAARVAESEAALTQTDAKLTDLDAKNQEARARLDSYADGPEELQQGAQEVDATGQSLIDASVQIEQRIAAAAESHRAGMAAVPARELPDAAGAGPAGSLARTPVAPEQRYDQRTNLNLAGGLSEMLGSTVLYGTGAEPPSEAARRESQAAELARRQAEVNEINAMCDGHFERLGPGDKALHALKLTGRHLWGGVTETKWPQFARHLVQALIDPRISMMGIVSGLSMILSGFANIGNVQAWKTDPVGNALKIAADIATGITIVLASVVGLATAILALAWAIAILSFGLAGGVAAVLTPICTSVIGTVFPWTVIAAKWALGLQALLFMKNLVDAATATSASDLQNQADQMTEDAKQGAAMAAIIVVAKAGEVGGRAIANTRFGAAVGRGVQSVGEWAKIYPAPGAAGGAVAGEVGAGAVAGDAAAGDAAAAGARPGAVAGDAAAGEAAAGARPGAPRPTNEVPGAPGERPVVGERETIPPSERPIGCFVAGTAVLTPGGPRAIESLARGDIVLAGDPDGDDAEHPVRRVWVHQADSVLDLRVGGGELTCTGAHPFWVDGGWRPAAGLRVGDALTTAEGGTVPVEAVTRRMGAFTVYNLAVAGLETYFVGDAQILVHNKSQRNTRVPETPETAAARQPVNSDLSALDARARAALTEAEALAERPDLARQLRDLRENLDSLDSTVQEAQTPAEIESVKPWRDAIAEELGELEAAVQGAKPPPEVVQPAEPPGPPADAIPAPRTPTEPALTRLNAMEANGEIAGDVANLRQRLSSPDNATRLGAEAELLELEGQVRAGERPVVRGAQAGTDQATYEVKARTEPFADPKNLNNSFAGQVKAANTQFVNGGTTGEVRINMGEHVTFGGDPTRPITTEMVRQAVAEAVATGGRATNVTRVVVRTGDGTIVYQGLGE